MQGPFFSLLHCEPKKKTGCACAFVPRTYLGLFEADPKTKERSCSGWGHDPATASRQRNSKNQSTKCAVLPKSHMSSLISEMGQANNQFREFLSRILKSRKWRTDTLDLQLFLFKKKVHVTTVCEKAKTLKTPKRLLKLQIKGSMWVYLSNVQAFLSKIMISTIFHKTTHHFPPPNLGNTCNVPRDHNAVSAGRGRNSDPPGSLTCSGQLPKISNLFV